MRAADVLRAASEKGRPGRAAVWICLFIGAFRCVFMQTAAPGPPISPAPMPQVFEHLTEVKIGFFIRYSDKKGGGVRSLTLPSVKNSTGLWKIFVIPADSVEKSR